MWPEHQSPPDEKPQRERNGRIMYIESKAGGLVGPARIGRVTSSRTFVTLYYGGRTFHRFKGGYKANYFDAETRDEYWISGPKRNGEDRLYVSHLPVEIDDDVREEYWGKIRKQPENSAYRTTRGFIQS